MGFRQAYSSFKKETRPGNPLGTFRDPSPEEWKKVMDQYYIQQRKKTNGVTK